MKNGIGATPRLAGLLTIFQAVLAVVSGSASGAIQSNLNVSPCFNNFLADPADSTSNLCRIGAGDMFAAEVGVGTTNVMGVSRPPADGFLGITGSTLFASGIYNVGSQTNGFISISQGGRLMGVSSLNILGRGTATSSVGVTGEGSLVESRQIIVGDAGRGVLAVSDKAQVNFTGPQASILVGLGTSGWGGLDLSGGATVSGVKDFYIAGNAADLSWANLAGAGTAMSMTAASFATVAGGQGANGSLQVTDQAAFTGGADALLIVGGTGGQGRLDINRKGLVSFDQVAVGIQGAATSVVDVNAGGKLNVRKLVNVDGSPQAEALLLLRDADSIYTMADGGNTDIGSASGGNARLLVLDSATMRGGYLHIGASGLGVGSMFVTRGGNVESLNGLDIGGTASELSFADIVGSASKVSVKPEGLVTVGLRGPGRLQIDDGAILHGGSLSIGKNSGTGEVHLRAGAKILELNALDIGESTSAALSGLMTLAGMASVSAQTVTVGFEPGSSGILSLEDSVLKASGYIAVGVSGSGLVDLDHGAVLDSHDIWLGFSSTGAGHLRTGDINFAQLRVGVANDAPSSFTTILARNSVEIGQDGSGLVEIGHGDVRVGVDTAGSLLVGKQGTLKIGGGAITNGENHISLGNTTGGVGNMRVSPGGKVHLIGQGNLINVYRGEFVTSGRMILELTGDRSELVSPFPLGSEVASFSDTSTALLLGTIELGWVKPPQGRVLLSRFLPVLNARTITSGIDGHQIVTRLDNGTVSVVRGAVEFIVPEFAADGIPSGLGVMAPQRLSVKSVGGQMVDVLGFRGVGVHQAIPGQRSLDQLALVTTIDAAKELAQGQAFTAALMTQAAYSDLPSSRFVELTSMDVDGLFVRASQSTSAIDTNDIVIAVRGTEPSIKANWDADFGFAGIPTATLRQYVTNLSEFVASVHAANPEATIRLAGHSLGGGLAQIVGWATGIDAYAFNAPPVGNVFTDFSSATAVVANLRDNGGLTGLLNVRLDGDPVSALPFTPLGQTITLRGDPLIYWLNHASELDPLTQARLTAVRGAMSIGGALGNGLDSHRIDGYLRWIDSPIVGICYGQSCQKFEADPASIEEALSRIHAPSASSGPSSTFDLRGILPGLLHILDPQVAHGYSFTSREGGPNFSGVVAPLIPGGESVYDVEVLQEGQWVLIGTTEAGSLYEFGPGGVATFRLRSFLLDDSSVLSVEEFFFGVMFADSGDAFVTISELDAFGNTILVPEPSTYALLLLGLICTMAAARSRTHRAPHQIFSAPR